MRNADWWRWHHYLWHVFSRVFLRLFYSRWLVEIWQISGQGNWRRNSNFIDVVASSPSFSGPVTIAPWRACLTPLQHASVTSHLARGLSLTYSDMAMDAIKFLCVEIQARNILKRNYFSFWWKRCKYMHCWRACAFLSIAISSSFINTTLSARTSIQTW